MAVTTTYDWLKQIPTSLLKQDEIPLLGFPPSFSWDQFVAELKKAFQTNDLSIQPGETEWKTAENVLSGLGSNLIPLYFNVSGMRGTVCWVLPESDIRAIMALLLNQDELAAAGLDRDFLTGFYQFLTLETLQSIARLDFGKIVSPHPLEKNELPQQDSLCTDISIVFKGKSFVGRLVLSPDFRQAWKERFAQRKLDLPIGNGLGEKIQLIVHLEGGRTALQRSEWAKIHPGDFILLDHCSLDPDGDKGRVMLTLNGMPLFRAKVKDGNIKILEHPLYHEVETAMANEPKDEFDEEEELDEEFEIEGEELEEEIEEVEEKGKAKAPAAAPKAAQPQPQPAAATPGAEKPVSGVTLVSEGKPVSAEDIPMTIIVEVGRIQISLQKLLDLQPGNLLELDIHPENGVDLVVNGRRLAKGELLRVGEALGIRILDMG